MANFIGRTRSVGLGKEPTRGVNVAPTYWIPQTDFTVMDKDDKIMDQSALGRIERDVTGDPNHQWAEGALNGILRDTSFGLVLLSAFGTDTPIAKAAPNAVVYDHTFTVANTNTHQSLTIASKDQNEDVRFGRAVLNKLEIKAELGQYIHYTADFISAKSAASTNTVAYAATDNPLRPQDLSLKIATTTAGLSGATAIPLKSLTLTIEKNAEADYALGSTAINEIFNKEFSTTVSMDLLYNDTAYKNIVFAGTKQAMQIGLTRTDLTIGSSANPGLVFTFQPGFFTDWNKQGGLGDIMTQTLAYQGLFSTSTSSELSAVLTNLVASY